MAKTTKKIFGVATTLHVCPETGIQSVTYHQTVVAKMNPLVGNIRLDSGGYRTTTTKKRINQALEHWGSQARVFQKDYMWYLDRGNGTTCEFADGMAVQHGFPRP